MTRITGFAALAFAALGLAACGQGAEDGSAEVAADEAASAPESEFTGDIGAATQEAVADTSAAAAEAGEAAPPP